jgi:hypothetical protein
MNAAYQVTEIQGIPWVPGLFFGLALLAAGVVAGYYYRDGFGRRDDEIEDVADDTEDDEVELTPGTWTPLRWVANKSTVHYVDCTLARNATPIQVWTPEAAAKWALAAKPPLKGCRHCYPFAQPAVAEMTP